MTESRFYAWTEIVDVQRQVNLTLTFLESLKGTRWEDLVITPGLDPLEIDSRAHKKEDFLFAFLYFALVFYGDKPLIAAIEWRLQPHTPADNVPRDNSTGDFVMVTGDDLTMPRMMYVVEVKDCESGGKHRKSNKRSDLRKQAERYYRAFNLIYEPEVPLRGVALFGTQCLCGEDYYDSNTWTKFFSDIDQEFQFKYVSEHLDMVIGHIKDEYVTHTKTQDDAPKQE
jgi:hypothetical protein